MNTIILTQNLLDDFSYLNKSLTLFDQTSVYLNQKKEWNLLDWGLLLLSGGIVVHSTCKTVDDGRKLIESFRIKPLKALKPLKPLKPLTRKTYKVVVTKRNPFLLTN